MCSSALQQLCDMLDACTGPVDLDRLKALMQRLDLTREDVADYCFFGDTNYRRNSVHSSDWYELLVICWRPGHKSYIHDHDGSSCCFRVVEGHADEVVCTSTGGKSDKGQPLVRPVKVNHLDTGHVCGSSSAHIHEVVNPSQTGEDLITVHVYSPPLHMRIYTYEEGADPHVRQSADELHAVAGATA